MFPQLINILFAAFIIVHIVGMHILFADMGQHFKTDANETVSQFSYFLLSISPIYSCFILGLLLRSTDWGGFFRLPNFNYSQVMSIYPTLAVIWLTLFAISMIFAKQWYIYIGIFLLINGLVTLIVPFTVHYQKLKLEKMMGVEGGESTNQIGKPKGQLQQEQSILKQLNWQEHKLIEEKFKALQLDDFYHLQKWMRELKNANELSSDCSSFRKIYNQMSQRCFDYNLKLNEQQLLCDLAEQEIMTDRIIRPQEPPPYNDVTVKPDMAGRFVVTEDSYRPAQSSSSKGLKIDVAGRPFFDE